MHEIRSIGGGRGAHGKETPRKTRYQHRFAGNGTRMRRIGIVALARKLLVALWRYLETGVVPEGAHLKAAEV